MMCDEARLTFDHDMRDEGCVVECSTEKSGEFVDTNSLSRQNSLCNI